MSFTAYELAVNPRVQENLRAEIDQEEITYEGLTQMKYLDMVVSEVLRKWPPFFVTDRVPVKPFTIEGNDEQPPLRLEPGVVCLFPIFSMHRDAELFAEPEMFIPERFSEENKPKILPYTYMPFGKGPRNCIGSRFALLDIKLVIACLLKNFELIVIDRTPIPLILKKASVHPTAEGGFWIGLKRRHRH